MAISERRILRHARFGKSRPESCRRSSRPPVDPDTQSRAASAGRPSNPRANFVARRFPALKHAPVVETRVCQYENTSNGDFLIDQHPDFQNVWLVGGGSGHGFKHGPSVGEYVAARVTGSSPQPKMKSSRASRSTQNKPSKTGLCIEVKASPEASILKRASAFCRSK